MDNVNKTLYIPLYGKAFVSKKNIIIHDKKAEQISEQVKFDLQGKSKSKWLAYYMAMRSTVYDDWVKQEISRNANAVVLYIGCGLDSRVERVSAPKTKWYDIDFPEVITERKRYFYESDCYHMLAADMRKDEWKKEIDAGKDAIIMLEGVSMYFAPEELAGLLSSVSQHFNSVRLLMDCIQNMLQKPQNTKTPSMM